MTTDISIQNHVDQYVLEVAVETSMLKIPKVLGHQFPRIKQYLNANNIETAGAPYARYLKLDWNSILTGGFVSLMWQMLTHKQAMQIGFPAATMPPGVDDMVASKLSLGRCVQTIHHGANHKVGETYKKVAQWALENNVRLADNSMESYITDPGEVPVDQLETLILIPVES